MVEIAVQFAVFIVGFLIPLRLFSWKKGGLYSVISGQYISKATGVMSLVISFAILYIVNDFFNSIIFTII